MKQYIDRQWAPATGSTPGTALGWALASSGAVAHPALSTGELRDQLRRTTFSTGAAPDERAGLISTDAMCWRSGANGLGGFSFNARFCVSSGIEGTRAFIGLSESATSCVDTADPSTLQNTIGVGFDTADPAADPDDDLWYLISNDGAAGQTKVPVPGMARLNTSHVYDLTINAMPGDADGDERGHGLHVIVRDVSAGKVLLDEVLTGFDMETPPDFDSFLYAHAEVWADEGDAVSMVLELAGMSLGQWNGTEPLPNTHGIFNVLDYGADPTGTADSYQAFKDWSAAITSAGGGTGIVPPGQYLIDHVVTGEDPHSEKQHFVFEGCNGLHWV